jgi:hypothetical protein
MKPRGRPFPSVNIIERLERRAGELRDGECWESDYKCTNGFGHVILRLGSTGHIYQHRLAWEAHNAEPIPEGMCVLHKCDNPRCFNPEHLFLGTRKDNTHDMCTKGRHNGNRNRCPETGRYN